MNIYVASRFTQKKKIKKINELLRSHGHKIVFDWTDHKDIQPYDKNAEYAKIYAKDDLNGVKKCDVFILLTSHEPGAGSSTELGAAIMSHLLTGNPKIYVVGKYINNNFCYFHPNVIKKKTIEEVIKEL